MRVDPQLACAGEDGENLHFVARRNLTRRCVPA
jgi:hypothetical protein